MAGKAWQRVALAVATGAHTASTSRKQRDVATGDRHTVPFLFILGPHPIKGLHLEGIFPVEVKLYANDLTDTPRS